MVYKTVWISFLLAKLSIGIRLGVYNGEPYMNINSSVCMDIWNSLASDLNISYNVTILKDESSAVTCVENGDCDMTIGRLSSALTASYPILTDYAVILTKDLRPSYVKDVFWQYLVLIFTIWAPLVIIFSHLNYFFETRVFPYHIGIFKAIGLIFTVSSLKNPLNKILVGLSWIFLLFIIVLIISDMGSIISNGNSNDNIIFSSTGSCSTVYWIQSTIKDTLSGCLSRLSSQEVQYVIAGKLELSITPSQDWEKFVLTQSTNLEIFLHLLLPAGSDTSKFDGKIQKYWINQVIYQYYMKYLNISYTNYSRYSLVFQEFTVILVGISILAVFILVVGIMCLIYKPPPKDSKSQDPGASKSFLSKGKSHTISLDQSLSNRLGSGRPEEWVNKAVDINDEKAHKIKNVQDYENELSAVIPVMSSFGSDKSLASLIKSSRK